LAFSKEGRDTFLSVALSPAAEWKASFSDLNAAVARMATLAQGGWISVQLVHETTERFVVSWRGAPRFQTDLLSQVLSPVQLEEPDPFERGSARTRCSDLSEAAFTVRSRPRDIPCIPI
jgi:transcriptional regulatory protein RtcR